MMPISTMNARWYLAASTEGSPQLRCSPYGAERDGVFPEMPIRQRGAEFDVPHHLSVYKNVMVTYLVGASENHRILVFQYASR